MKHFIYRIIVTTLAFILVFCSMTFASGSGFQIPDFIPERFSDLEWRIFGDLNWSADGTDYNNTGSERSYYRQSIRFGTDVLYRFYTPDNFYNVGGDFSLSLKRSRRNSESTSPPNLSYFSYSEDSQITKSINIDFNPELETGSYLVSDYFASGKASLNLNYNHTFPSQSEFYNYRRSSYGDREEIRINSIDRESENTDIRTRGSFEMSIGRGRVYEGKYASTAMYMVEELKNQGLLVRELNNDEMLALTESVYQLRQKHQVDRRIFKIDALKEILDFLIETGAMDQESILSYLTIQDVWDYFPHKKNRRFGSTAKLGFGFVEDYWYRKNYRKEKRELQYSIDYRDSSLTDFVDVYSTREEYEQSNSSGRHNEYIFGELSFYKPLSRRLQLNCESKWNFFLNRGGAYLPLSRLDVIFRSSRSTFNTSLSDLHDYVNGVTRVELNYIYNSRTELDLNALISYETYRYNNSRRVGVNLVQSRESLYFELSTVLTYRVSIPTELRIRMNYASSELNSGFNFDNDSSTQKFTLSGSINHYLF